MINYEIKANEEDIREAASLFEFVGGNSRDAVRIAINRTAPKVRTLASSQIRTQVRLKAGYVRDRLAIKRATRSNLSGAIQTPSRGLLLSRFSTDTRITNGKTTWLLPPPEPPRGLKVKVKPSGSAKLLGSDNFYMVLPGSKALAIVRRRDKPGPGGGKIDVLYGPSLSQVFDDVRDQVLPQASDEYQDQLLDAMRYLLQKLYPPEQ